MLKLPESKVLPPAKKICNRRAKVLVRCPNTVDLLWYYRVGMVIAIGTKPVSYASGDDYNDT